MSAGTFKTLYLVKKEEKEHVRKILQQLFAAGADVLETGGNE